MDEVTTIGIDIAKHVFQFHGVDGAGEVVMRRRLRRDQVAAPTESRSSPAEKVLCPLLIVAGAGDWVTGEKPDICQRRLR